MAKKPKWQIEYEELRSVIKLGLLEQLKQNGTSEKHYIDLVDDYMKMWDTKNDLTADIKARGSKVESPNSGIVKTNESVTDLLKINAQMLKLLDSMGIKPEPKGDDGDEM